MCGDTLLRACPSCKTKTEFDVSYRFENAETQETYYTDTHKCKCGFVFNPDDKDNIKKYKSKLAFVMS